MFKLYFQSMWKFPSLSSQGYLYTNSAHVVYMQVLRLINLLIK